jgi:hypothetical protein
MKSVVRNEQEERHSISKPKKLAKMVTFLTSNRDTSWPKFGWYIDYSDREIRDFSQSVRPSV